MRIAAVYNFHYSRTRSSVTIMPTTDLAPLTPSEASLILAWYDRAHQQISRPASAESRSLALRLMKVAEPYVNH